MTSVLTTVEKGMTVKVDVNVADEMFKQFLFGPENDNWVPNIEHNEFFLRGIQNYMNDVLLARGHVYLNEIFDALGMPRTIEGQILGWAKALVVNSHIDFSIRRAETQDGFMLQFNVDGPILGWM